MPPYKWSRPQDPKQPLLRLPEEARMHQSQERGPESRGRTAALGSLELVPPGLPPPSQRCLPLATMDSTRRHLPPGPPLPTPSPADVWLVEPRSHDETLAAREAAGAGRPPWEKREGARSKGGNSPAGGGGSRVAGQAKERCTGALQSRGGGLSLVRGAQPQLSPAVKGTPRPATGASTSSSFICPFAHSLGR